MGAFPEAMRNLERTGLGEVLIERAAAGVPLLGICLGMQLLFESSHRARGRRRASASCPGRSPALRVTAPAAHRLEPRDLRARRRALTEGLGDAAAFYHVHSFACRPADPTDVVGTSEYGERFVSVVERGNVMASQFHPEKSSRDGLRMLRNFAQLAAVAVA